MREWISVNFAVPPDERNVLVIALSKWKMSNGKERQSYNIYIANRIAFKNGNIKWRCTRGGYIQDNKSETKVTHWMPLPEEPNATI